ncbi:MAG: ABC transporter ATP-binding protein [Solobacterium sp.]|nr:ABC transporter ATP-binding protein [Solobacterium sp.]
MSENNREIAIKLSGVKKMYKLGQIGGGTLQGDLQSWWARVRGKEDPNTMIGQKQRLVGQTFMALNGIDLTIYQGEALGIIGANGAGKSTMLKLLSKVTAPSDGEIDIYGRVASMLEVGTGFNGEMTGRENIYMNGAILGMTKAEIDAKMEDIIEFSEVREFIDTPVKRYSSGMYVKLAFSVAAHLDSEIMIMDEVLAVGDMAFQKKCLTKMREAANKEGRTVLYVSHNMNTIRQLCDRCIVLDKGKIIFDGDVEEAIDIYLGTTGVMSTYYDFLQPTQLNRNAKGKVLFKYLKTLNSADMKFYSDSRIEMEIALAAPKPLEKVKLRFEVRYQNGITSGTSFLDKPFNLLEGDNTVTLHFDTTHFVAGKYYVDLVAYIYNQFGNEEYLNGIYPGFAFEIIEDINENNELVWLPQYWGSVHLHDTVLVK